MPTDTEAASRTPSPPSAASRYLFIFLLGFAAGVVLVVMLLRVLDMRRGWQDDYPQATMQLMHAHVAQLRATATAGRCAASDVVPHLRSLRSLANDLEPAFPALGDDARFVGHAGAMRAALDAAIADPPGECGRLADTLQTIGDGCSACHRDFRG